MALGKRLIQTSGAAECTTETVTAFGANAANSTNYAIYKLDGDSNDVTTNYNATNNVSFNSSGKFGQSATFNNTNTFIELPSTIDDPMRTAGAFTVSLWYKHATQTNAYGGKILSLLNNIYNLITAHASNNTITAIVNNSSNSSSSVTSSALSTGTWYHIVWTGNATNGVSLYIDSVLIGNAAWDGTFFSYTDTNYKYNRLGYQNLSIASLVGELDQARFFNRAVTSSEVAELYAETSSTTSNENLLNDGAGVALYSLDYDASDTGGLYDGTPTDVDFGVGGQINTGARFNGSSSKIEVSNQVIPNGAASISFWYNANGNTGTQYILGGGVATASKGITVYLSEISTGNHSFGALVAKGVSSLAGSATGTTVYSTTSWHHVVCTWDGTTSSNALKVYVNNSLLAQGTIDTTSASIGTYTNFAIGGLNGGTFADGTVDQVRIFSKVLSTTEVSTLYAETACVHTATTDDIDYPVTNAAYYKLDNSAEDSKGTNDGTETDIEYRFGRYGQAAVFNGSSSGIGLPKNSTISPANDFTYSLWFKSDGTTFQTLFSHLGNTNPKYGVFLNHSSDTSQSIRFFYSTGSNSQGNQSSTANVWNVGQWHHLVITKSSSAGLKGYLDADEIITDATLTADLTPYTLQNGNSNLGVYQYLTSGGKLYYMDGQIDQVRIFTSALSAANILKLAEEKPETDTSNFKAVLYEGTGASQYISNVGMDLETSGGLVWIKSRSSSSYWHTLFDTVRGPLKRIFSNSTSAESNTANTLTSFDSNGFTIGNQAGQNANNITYVAWNWKGGGTAVSNGNGSITSSVSANTAAGFSIVTYTGTSTIGDTIGHGLGTPDLIIVKNRDNSSASWAVWSSTFSAASETLFLDLTSPSNQYINRFGTVNSTTFQAGSSGGTEVNASGNNFVAYIFKSVSGYSKIGSYSGGSSGNQITGVGFKPNFLVIKRTDSAGGWRVQDVRRKGTSGTNKNVLEWNDPAIEQVNYVDVSFDTDGFTLNTTSNDYNNSSGTYIYLAIK